MRRAHSGTGVLHRHQDVVCMLTGGVYRHEKLRELTLTEPATCGQPQYTSTCIEHTQLWKRVVACVALLELVS